MNFLKSLASLFSGSARGSSGVFYPLTVRCNRCGELVHGQVNLNNDLSLEYAENGEPSGYTCRKVLMGSGRCFQQIEITLTYNAKRALTNKTITGGEFVDQPAS